MMTAALQAVLQEVSNTELVLTSYLLLYFIFILITTEILQVLIPIFKEKEDEARLSICPKSQI